MTEPDHTQDTPVFEHKKFLEHQVNQPGVYQMFGVDGNILYAGKAKALNKRLSSYFQKNVSPKTKALVAKISRIEVTITATETEALLLEQNIIKQQRPPYNILLRDDKSYPYIYVATDAEYPRMDFHRGPKRMKGRYFGPYPGAASVRESLQFLQKTFRVRQCDDNFFNNRSRPCLQYQIHRCSAPCVGAISVEQYANDVRHSLLFLEGKETLILEELANDMESASDAQNYEEAAHYRDQITYLRQIREPQSIEEGDNDADVIAVQLQKSVACVQVLTIRQGRVLGSRSYFPQLKIESTEAEILAAFLSQYYLGIQERMIPPEVILDRPLPDDREVIQAALMQASQKRVSLVYKVRSHRAKWQQLAIRTAEQNLLSRLSVQHSHLQRLERLQELLSLETLPERIECFDISHSSGEATVASCVVFDGNGAVKSDYRRFNITDIKAGDDYAAMQQVLERRYTRVQEEEGKLPDILVIDGGKGQLGQAKRVMTELQLQGITLIGVAKGTTRKAGFETLVLERGDKEEWYEKVLDNHHPALHLLQQIRDEAHRFAVTGHKQRRDKQRRTSVLEGIPGIGAKRRRELLRFFGGQQEIARAGIEELQQVPGINETLAQAIHDAYHGG